MDALCWGVARSAPLSDSVAVLTAVPSVAAHRPRSGFKAGFSRALFRGSFMLLTSRNSLSFMSAKACSAIVAAVGINDVVSMRMICDPKR